MGGLSVYGDIQTPILAPSDVGKYPEKVGYLPAPLPP